MGHDETFVCAQCGQTHAGAPTDYGFKLPDDAFAIPKALREERVKANSDLCYMDGRCFFRGMLKIPFVGHEGYFGWGVWVEVERAVFERYAEIYNVDANHEPPAGGNLANRIHLYPDATGERVVITFGSAIARPEFHVEGASESSLARDQRFGIAAERHHEYLASANG